MCCVLGDPFSKNLRKARGEGHMRTSELWKMLGYRDRLAWPFYLESMLSYKFTEGLLRLVAWPHVITAAAAAAKSFQLCPTLCDPTDGSPPGSPIPGILQARTLEWVAISFSNAWKWKVKVNSLNCIHLFTTPWTAAYQAPPSMGFSRQEYWSGLPLPSPY